MPADRRITAALAALDAAREVLAAVAEEPAPGPSSTRPLLLKFGEAAAEAGLSRTAIFEAVKNGELVAVECPGTTRRIRRSDLHEFVERLAS
jgi:excisionase family DNA binding protein